MGAVWCTPLLVNFTVYRYQHLAHHQHTGEDGDTESWPLYRSLLAYLFTLTGFTLWRNSLFRIIRTFRDDFPASVTNEPRRCDARRDNWVICSWLALVMALTFMFPLILLFAYWLPLLFYAPAAILISLPEHYGLNDSVKGSGNTRTIRSNRLARFVLWNANYHAEHHSAPGMPSISLPLQHKATTGPDGNAQENSYLAFHFRLVTSLFKSSIPGSNSPKESNNEQGGGSLA